MIDKFKREFDIVYDYVIALAIGALQAIDPLYYTGLIAGSEFETYNAMKLYIAHSVNVGIRTSGQTSPNSVVFYDENNVSFFRLLNACYAYNSGAANFNWFPNNAELTNFYFARLTSAGAENIKFIGYRLTFV